jgi:excisionase family DNA binding protein
VTEDPGPLLFTVAEAARLLGVSRSTAYNLISAGELEVVHIGRCIRVPATAAASFVEALREPSARSV